MIGSPKNYRDLLLSTSTRLKTTSTDIITISSSAEAFTYSGTSFSPSSILLTVTLGTNLSSYASSIVWLKDGVLVSGASGTTYAVPAPSLGASGSTYTAKLTIGGTDFTATKFLNVTSIALSYSINPTTISVSTASDGSGGTWEVPATFNIYAGLVDASSGWSYAWSGTGISISNSTNKTCNITGMSIDSSTLTCTASKSGFSSISNTITVSKAKQGTPGTSGASTGIAYIRSSTTPATPSTTTNPPSGWSATIPAGSTQLWQSNGTLAAGSSSWSWSTPFKAEGSSGTSGIRSANGYVYWSSASAGQPPPSTPSSTYTFSTATFYNLGSWSNTITFQAGGTNYAMYYTVQESSAGSDTGTVVFSSPFQHTSFNGLVTFTSLGGDGTNTFIDGGKITSGTITGRKIRTADSGNRVEMENPGATYPHTFTGYSSTGATVFKLTANTSINDYGTVLKIGDYYNPVSRGLMVDASDVAIWGYATNYGVVGTSTGSGAGVSGGSTSGLGVRGTSVYTQGGYFYGGEGVRALGNASGSGGSAVHAETTFGAGVYGIGTTHDFYAGGSGMNYGPFTGGHDGLMEISETVEIGDILIDMVIVSKRNVSNTILKVSKSTSANQKGAVGVFVNRQLLTTDSPLPSALVNDAYILDPYKDNLEQAFIKNWYHTNAPTDILLNNIDRVAFNAVGEGQINVCGEGGDLEVGDLIVTSSLPGKGMKQSDDIIRSYTVAKCREPVTFSSPTEVKMVACIYLCG